MKKEKRKKKNERRDTKKKKKRNENPFTEIRAPIINSKYNIKMLPNTVLLKQKKKIIITQFLWFYSFGRVGKRYIYIYIYKYIYNLQIDNTRELYFITVYASFYLHVPRVTSDIYIYYII